jgi:hypothetical protein
MLPLSVMAVSEPPGLDQAPGSSFHRSRPLPGLLCGRSGSGCAFPNFRWLRRSPFHPLGILTVDRGSATLLSIAWSASPDRVLGVHATPFPLGGKVPPGRHQPAPGSYCCIRRLMSDLSIERWTIFLSPEGSIPIVQTFTSRCSVLRRPSDRFRLITRAACLGLHTTPVDFSATALPGCHPPRSSSRRTHSLPGLPTLSAVPDVFSQSLGPALSNR